MTSPHLRSPQMACSRALQVPQNPEAYLTRGRRSCLREDGVKKEEEAGARTSSPPVACYVTVARPRGSLVFVPPPAVLAFPLTHYAGVLSLWAGRAGGGARPSRLRAQMALAVGQSKMAAAVIRTGLRDWGRRVRWSNGLRLLVRVRS